VLHLKCGCMARRGKRKESYCDEKRCLVNARGAGTCERGRVILDFKLSPCSVSSVLTFGCFPGVWFILADVSEHSSCSIFKADDLEVM
jgi:hypothetical protein